MIRRRLPHAPPPQEAHARLAALHPTTFLLESRTGPARLSRYSIVGWDPSGTVELDAKGLTLGGDLPRPLAQEPPLDYLRRLLRKHRVADAGAPFAGGLVGVAASDLARTLEPSLGAGDEPWPRLLLGLYLDALVYDHARGSVHYVSVGPDRGAHLKEALRRRAPKPVLKVGPARASHSRRAFTKQVRAAQDLIRAGECFQVVLSRSYSAAYHGDLAACYDRLRRTANAPHLFFLRFGGPRPRVLLGASPETLVRVRRGQATTFPIAGTRPLTGRSSTDAAAARSLRADPKENAEHAMLVDLARNDLARVCRPGSVEVRRFRRVEPFGTVQHLVSEVRGRLSPRRDALDAFAAVFPAGTVSGAPKLRALEHIDRLEGAPRGPYAGAVLYASFTGDLDSAIAIRCLSAQDGQLAVQAGAGIVLASRPDAEFDETRHKARLLLSAVARFGSTLPEEGPS